jgi:SAM-dependent methyltransferase
MIHILLFILQIISLVILFSIIMLLTLWAIGNFRNQVPFVTTSNSILKDIEKALSIKDDSIVYDLGCGDGRILMYLSRMNPKAKYIGIENNLFPIILARIGSFFNNKKTKNKIEIIKNDFFKQDLKNATHVFAYLYPHVMDDLLSKFEEELRPGTRLVSLSFGFMNKNPIEEIDLKRNKYRLGRKLYIYEF